MNKITTETKEQYKKRFWFMKQLSEKVGEDFLICSEELAYAFVWELCERIQEELTDTEQMQGDRLLQVLSFISKFPYATDEEIIGRAKELYGLKC